jgi:hypothetical protein
MHASHIHFVFPLTQNVVDKFFAVHDKMVYNSSWFEEVDTLDEGCGRHRDMLDYSLTL